METFIGIVGTAIITFAGTILVVKLQKERRVLGYQVLTAELIIPDVKPGSGLLLTAKRSLVDPDTANESNEVVPVRRVFGFRVSIENAGNAVLEDQRVTIRLDDGAKIILVAVESAPDMGEYAIETRIDPRQRNLCFAQLPFLNPKQVVVLSLQSVDNGDRTCTVSAGGKGLIVRDQEKYFRRIGICCLLTVFAALIGTVAIWVGALNVYTDPNRTVTQEMFDDGLLGWSFAISEVFILLVGSAAFIILTFVSPRWTSRGPPRSANVP